MEPSNTGTHQTPKGWHRENIKAAIRMRGVTCSELARRHGYHEAAVHRVLGGKRWSHLELIIADFIGEQPSALWPDRWTAQRKPRYRAQRQRLATQ